MKNNIKLFTTNTKTQDGTQKHDIAHRQPATFDTISSYNSTPFCFPEFVLKCHSRHKWKRNEVDSRKNMNRELLGGGKKRGGGGDKGTRK